MRIRQIKPAWWTDRALRTRVKADTREFYIGLWMLADDDGWFEWDQDAIGMQLFGYLPVTRREREVARHAKLLVELDPDNPHLILHPCGHAEVQKMPGHQRLAGPTKRVTTDHLRHLQRCLPADARGSHALPRVSPHGNGTERGTELGTERNGTRNGSARAARDVEVVGDGTLKAELEARGLNLAKGAA